MRPSCASTILRQMESPIPVPCGFVVKNGSNILSRVCSFKPHPLSRTVTIGWPTPLTVLQIVNSRARPVFIVASIPLVKRLSSNCCICTGSTRRLEGFFVQLEANRDAKSLGLVAQQLHRIANEAIQVDSLASEIFITE